MTTTIDPHFLAAFMACESACMIVDLLPDNDLVEELTNLIEIQYTLFKHMVEGKHYGTDNLNEFIQYAATVKTQMERLRKES